MTSVKFDNSGFKIIKEALSDKYKVRVGVLGSKATESHGDKITNAFIAHIHEYGSISMNIPKRSFLRVPLELKIWDWVKANKDGYYEMMKINKLRKWYAKLGLAAEAIVKEAFSTKGYGTWKDNAPITISGGWMRNPVSGKLFKVKGKGGDGLPLNDTAQLKNSISNKVLNDK